MPFGDWLRSERKRANLTLEELSERAGCSKNYLSVLERNVPHHQTGALPRPSRETVEDIARGLGVPEADALRAAGYAPIPKAALIYPDGTGFAIDEGETEKRTLTDADVKAIAREFQKLLGPLLPEIQKKFDQDEDTEGGDTREP